MTLNQDIKFEETSGKGGKIGEIILNRPKALNALTLEMCQALANQLARWQKNAAIKAVLIKGEGERAFCAGGDIRELYKNRNEATKQEKSFFWHEYRMNAAIYHFPKPYISFLDGITMGGGVGISVHGSHRVATEKLKFAMPETSIGFFPDIGASHFLNKCPGKTGWYLGLTGNTINLADTYALGLVNHAVNADHLAELRKALINTEFSADDFEIVSDIIEGFSIPTEESELLSHQSIIDRCFSKDSLNDIFAALKNENDQWSQKILAILQSRSPTSLTVTFNQLTDAQNLEFDAIMEMEYNIAQSFLQCRDFFEGIRAMIIDKDRNPQWQPKSLSEIKSADIDQFFSDKNSHLFK